MGSSDTRVSIRPLQHSARFITGKTQSIPTDIYTSEHPTVQLRCVAESAGDRDEPQNIKVHN